MRNIIVVESREAVLLESGGGFLALRSPLSSERLAGTVPLPSRVTTVFQSARIARENVATAKLVYDRLQMFEHRANE